MGTDQIKQQLEFILDHVEITGPESYRIGELVSSPGEEELVNSLALDLYIHFYHRLSEVPGGGGRDMDERQFLNQLSFANSGAGMWEHGWKLVSLTEDGKLGVQKGGQGLVFYANPGQVKGGSANVEIGDTIWVYIGKEIKYLQPGFYVALGNGDEPDPAKNPVTTVRMYWNLQPLSAVEYIRLMTEGINGLGLPFRTKVLSSPGSYIRSDSGVLYMYQPHFLKAWDTIQEIYAKLRDKLNEDVPMFTYKVGKGTGIAEDPAGGESFGQSRTKLIAQGIFAGWQSGATGAEEQIGYILDTFRGAGLKPDRPFLEPGSNASYPSLEYKKQ